MCKLSLLILHQAAHSVAYFSAKAHPFIEFFLVNVHLSRLCHGVVKPKELKGTPVAAALSVGCNNAVKRTFFVAGTSQSDFCSHCVFSLMR